MNTAKNTLTSLEVDLLKNLRTFKSEQLHAGFVQETTCEREQLSKIVCYIYEVDRRKLYLQYNYTSLFDYLTKEMKYSAASAQRRLDAARLLAHAPELAQSIASGAITLSQISVVSQGLKQAKREAEHKGEKFTSSAEVKRNLLGKVKSHSANQAQLIVAQALDLEIRAVEKKVVQRDESLRLEMTFSKEEAELLKEVKDLLSHSLPGAGYKEILVAVLKEFKKRKGTVPSSKNALKQSANSGLRRIKLTPKVTSATEVRRSVFRRDKVCQWKHENGKPCGSTFQLQVDHKKSKWLGGVDEENNLQLLCSVHNRLKYQKEIGFRED